ncbi:hypothetical protein ACWATR_05905 [Nostoc sp. UIC 10890]
MHKAKKKQLPSWLKIGLIGCQIKGLAIPHRPTLLIERSSISKVGQFVIAQQFISSLTQAVSERLLAVLAKLARSTYRGRNQLF